MTCPFVSVVVVYVMEPGWMGPACAPGTGTVGVTARWMGECEGGSMGEVPPTPYWYAMLGLSHNGLLRVRGRKVSRPQRGRYITAVVMMRRCHEHVPAIA